MFTQLPSRSGFVSNVVHAKVMENHTVPVVLIYLRRYVPCYVIIHFSEILGFTESVDIPYPSSKEQH